MVPKTSPEFAPSFELGSVRTYLELLEMFRCQCKGSLTWTPPAERIRSAVVNLLFEKMYIFFDFPTASKKSQIRLFFGKIFLLFFFSVVTSTKRHVH